MLSTRVPSNTKPGFDLDFQSGTFLLSLFVQLVVIRFSVASMSGSISETLSAILLLETIVQGVEFAWYLVVGLLFLSGRSVDVVYRYLDWLVTTPVMLITLMLFLLFLHEPCLEYNGIVQKQPNLFALIAVSVVADWVMLGCGLYYEMKKSTAAFVVASVALLVAFVPHALVLANHFSWLGLEALLTTLVIWALYGVVSYALRSNEKQKNGAYNVLDIFSKNVAGVVVSVCALNSTC